MINEHGILLAFAVPSLTDEDLDWLDDKEAEEAIVMANYEMWERSREAVNNQPEPTLAQLLTRRARG